MTPEHARSLLGVGETATDAEIATAYRRLMQTVHPDVCTGPEAERLARNATEARETLRRTEGTGDALPGAGQKSRTGPGNADHAQDHDEAQLREIVLGVLDRCGGTATGTTLVLNILRETRSVPEHQRRVWKRRMTEAGFWDDGAALGLWTIRGNRITTQVDRAQSRPERSHESWSDRWESEAREAARKHDRGTTAAAREPKAGWGASTAVVTGLTVGAALTTDAAGNADWTSPQSAIAHIALMLVLVNIGLLIFTTIEATRFIDLSNPWRVLVPGLTWGALASWAILTAIS